MSLNSHRAVAAGRPGTGHSADILINQQRERRPSTAPVSPLDADSQATPGACALSACPIGCSAVVLSVRCPVGDACRLRALGIYEGARLAVVGTRPGMLIEVRGTRLALGATLAATVGVMPLDAA